MIDRRSRSALAPAAALLIATTALAACERRPYPEPSMAAPSPTAPPPELLGAPEDRDGRPLDATPPAYGELPPAPEQPGEPAPLPPQDEGRAEAYPPAPPRVIAMDPIPNPEDRPRVHRRAAQPDRYLRAEGIVPARPDRVIASQPVPNPEPRSERRRHVHAVAAPGGHRAAAPRRAHLHLRPTRPHHARHHLAPVHRHGHAAAAARAVVHPNKPSVAHKPAAAAPHAKPAAAKPASPKASAKPAPAAHPKAAPAAPAQNKALPAHPHIVPVKPAEVIKPKPPKDLVRPAVPNLSAPASPTVAPAKPAETKGRHHGKLTGRTPSAAPTAAESARLATLSGALTPVIAARASLRGPESLRPGTPGDVSLTVPQDFAEGLRSEAHRGGLGDAAASAALTARLAGEGYAVSPADAQSQPLMAGKPTEFRWTVTRMDAARGPLTAEVGADLLGGGKQHVELGTLTASEAKRAGISPRAIGAGLLALIVILVGFIMMGGRRREDAAPHA